MSSSTFGRSSSSDRTDLDESDLYPSSIYRPLGWYYGRSIQYSWTSLAPLRTKASDTHQFNHKKHYPARMNPFLTSPLTEKEMEEAIKHMRGYSSPGIDGLPAAFYQLTPSVFGECLQIVFDDQLRRGTLLRS